MDKRKPLPRLLNLSLDNHISNLRINGRSPMATPRWKHKKLTKKTVENSSIPFTTRAAKTRSQKFSFDVPLLESSNRTRSCIDISAVEESLKTVHVLANGGSWKKGLKERGFDYKLPPESMFKTSE